MIKRIWKIILIALGILVILAAALIAWLTATEYRPADVEQVPVEHIGESLPLTAEPEGMEFRILSWNTGYGDLDKNSDFFMDGGTHVRNHDTETVTQNVTQIRDTVASLAPDFCFLQEVDTDSARSGGISQRAVYATAFANNAYARNYSCAFVPYPLPFIGKVNSGLCTLTDYPVESAERIALPCPFSWPVSVANLKRCLLVSRIPLDGTDRELVMINLHLEAYDDGEGKAAQTKMLREIMEREYAAGNYVVAGGDFNQSFPEALDAYPIKNPELWTPGILSDEDLSEGWHFAYDVSVPSCRLLNRPYDPDSPETQFYTIDGFILSPNVELKQVETLDMGFAWTDHNPVLLDMKLK